MASAGEATDDGEEPIGDDESVYERYVAGVRIVEDRNPEGSAESGSDGVEDGDADRSHYRFEAPEHRGLSFDDPDLATLYADIYFDLNGFEEAGTGERGVPPIVIQAGRDTLAAYLLTQPYTDQRWVASFVGVRPEKVQRYVSRVHTRAEEIRRKVAAREAERNSERAGE